MEQDIAQRYLAAIPLPPKGERNQKLNEAAFALARNFRLSEDDHSRLLLDWISPTGLGATEAGKTIRSAWAACASKGELGSRCRPRVKAPCPAVPKSERPAQEEPPAVKYDLTGAVPLPEPMADPIKTLLAECFREGEGVRVVFGDLVEKDGQVKDSPLDSGITLTREAWLRHEQASGGINRLRGEHDRRAGVYVGVNPYQVGGAKDADVTSFRHALVEFDEGLTLEDQWELYQKSGIPCAAIITSGRRSLHAWVKIDAANRQEYDERVKVLFDHFAGAGLKVDTANKNPGRLSRLPGCTRLGKRQELIAVNTGATTWLDWQTRLVTDSFGEVTTTADLLAYDTDNDPNTVIGRRYLCRGGSLLLVGPSGVGKSSLAVGIVARWGLGLAAWGIKPVRAMKVLVVQAENDRGDQSEQLKGVVEGLFLESKNDLDLLDTNLIWVRNTTHTGRPFVDAIRRLVDRYSPDMVVLDPLLSFVGGDISQQDVCSEFLRNWLGPISEATGVCWFMVHHTGKPPTDKAARKGWQSSDWSYAGLGSSELTNWARAVAVLRQVGHKQFCLSLTKRGGRAGAVHPDGTPTETLWLGHSEAGVHWVHLAPPEEPADAPEEAKQAKAGAPSKVDRIVAGPVGPVWDSIPPEGVPLRWLQNRLLPIAQKVLGEEVSDGTLRNVVGRFVGAALEVVVDDAGKRTYKRLSAATKSA